MVTNDIKFQLANFDEISGFVERINDEIESKEIGYYHLPELGDDVINEANKFCGIFQNVVLIAIGGSSLGVKAIYEILPKTKTKLYFLDNLDENSFLDVVKNIEFEKTLFIVSSKSGHTIETISLFKLILDYFKPKNLDKNFIFITDEDSSLQKFAQKNGYNFLNLQPNVGGRFSVLSAVGLFPLTICGYDCQKILNGAKSCKERYLNGDKSIFQKAYHYATHKNITTNILFSYCDRLKTFNDWYIQLWAESLGKTSGYKRIGRTPIGLIGSKDQHSFLQLIIDGPKDKSVTFIKILENSNLKIPQISLDFLEGCDFVNGEKMSEILSSQCDATALSLQNEGISVDFLNIDKLDEESCGFLIFYFELLTSIMGTMLGINTYDQPGVEVGKRILKNLFIKKQN